MMQGAGCRCAEMLVLISAEVQVQRSTGTEERRCRGACAEVRQWCRGQRCKDEEQLIDVQRCRGADELRCREMQRRREGSEVQRCRGGAEVQRCRGADGAHVQRCRGAQVHRCTVAQAQIDAEVHRRGRGGAEVLRRCRVAEQMHRIRGVEALKS